MIDNKQCRRRWKHFIWSFLLVLAGLHSAADEGATQVKKDRELVRQAVEELYVRGLDVRDFDLITTICIPETVLMSAGRDGSLRKTSLAKWSKRFDPENPPFDKLEYAIEKIDVVGTAAQVKIRFVVDSERVVTDFLHMLKIDDKWRIVHIIDY